MEGAGYTIYVAIRKMIILAKVYNQLECSNVIRRDPKIVLRVLRIRTYLPYNAEF